MWRRDRKLGLVGLVLVCLAVTGFIMLWRAYQGEEDGYLAHIISHRDKASIPGQSPCQDDTSIPEQPSQQAQTSTEGPNQTKDGAGQPGGKSQPNETGQPNEQASPSKQASPTKQANPTRRASPSRQASPGTYWIP